MANYLAIDIGGTYIKYAILDETENLINHQQTKTPVNDNDAILREVQNIIKTMMHEIPVKGVGISTAGIVDREKGEIIYAGPTIKNYKGTAFKKVLSNKFILPIHVENDVNAALLGEIWKGAARNKNHVFCITLGTGIGGAYYHNELVDGFNEQANSVGYLLFDEETQTNYEMRASTSALTNMIKTNLGEDFTAKTVFEHAKNGDKQCLSILDSWAKEVAKGLAQIIILMDPKSIIIGGGVSAQGKYLLDLIEKHIPNYLPKNFFKTDLQVAQLFNDANLYGALYPFFKEIT